MVLPDTPAGACAYAARPGCFTPHVDPTRFELALNRLARTVLYQLSYRPKIKCEEPIAGIEPEPPPYEGGATKPTIAVPACQKLREPQG